MFPLSPGPPGRNWAGSLQLTLGKILRRPLLASEALDHPSALAPPRDRHLLAASRLRSLRAELRGSVRRGGPGRGAVSPSPRYPT